MESPPFFKHIFKNVQGEVQPVPGVQARLLCFRVSQAVIVVLARAVVSWESSAGEGSASRMTQVAGRILVLVAVARRLSFLAGFFRRPPSAPRGCSQCSDTWAPPPPHRTACFCRASKGRRKPPARQAPQSQAHNYGHGIS